MSLPVNNKKLTGKTTQNKDMGKGSKFIKTSSKSQVVSKKVRSTGANRGS